MESVVCVCIYIYIYMYILVEVPEEMPECVVVSWRQLR